MATKGILLCAWGKVCYGYAAFNLAASIKHLSPSMHITLMCDGMAVRDYSDQNKTVFDSIIGIEKPEDPGLFKVGIYASLPYDYTLFLDVDALALNPLEPLLDKLIADFEADPNKFFRCHVHAWYDHTSPDSMPMMYWATRELIWERYGFDETHKLPGTQSSIQFIAKCEQAEQFYQDLYALMRDNPIPLDLLKNRWGGTQPDELYLNIQIAISRLTPDIDKAIWFCDNGAMRPGQLTQDGYYLLSYFGVRERIKRYFMEWYDKEPIRFLRKLGFSNHFWKSHQIFDAKHAANKVKPIIRTVPSVNNLAAQRKADQEKFAPVHRKKTNLFTAYYRSKSPLRQKELDTCVMNNLNNPFIDRVVLVSECEVPFQSEKLEVIPFHRPTFREMVDIMNTNAQMGEIQVMCNSDIYTDQTIAMVSDFNLYKTVLCLCRHDLTHQGVTRFIEAEYSQDTWIWEGRLEFTGGDYNFGILGCDNVFAYQVNQSGYRVVNPSRHIKTTHLHITPERSYSEKTRLPRPYLHVPVGGIGGLMPKRMLLIQPGKVGDIIRCLPIAAHYADQGYTVQWQCPSMYHSLFDYVDYATPVVMPLGSYDKTIDISFGLNTQGEVHKLWLQRRPSLESFLSLKYELAGVPIGDSWNLRYNRNLKHEADLVAALGISPGTDYIVVHNSSDYGSPIEVDSVLPQVQFRPVAGFSIFDWRGVLEGAKEIHCIDSSLVNFADQLSLDAKLFYYKTDKVPLKADETLLSDRWVRTNLVKKQVA